MPPSEQLSHPDIVRLLDSRARGLTKNAKKAQSLRERTTDRLLVALKNGRYARQSGKPFLAFAYTVMRNLFLDDMRKPEREVDVGEHFDFVASLNLSYAPTQEKGSLTLKPVLEALAELPELDRNTLLAVGHGSSYEEAAAEVGISPKEFRSRIQVARRALIERLRKRGIEVSDLLS